MCHSTDSRPPGPPNPGEVAECGKLKLTSSDGAVFPAYYAIPAESNGTSVVVLPDVRGAHPFYAALVERFAEAGFHTVAIDYYGRTAGSDHRDDTFDWKQYVPQITSEEVQLDVKAAIGYLAERGTGPVFTVGFCYGGGQSWRLAASDLGLAGAIGFYGRPQMVSDVVDDITAPLLLLVAGADVATPREEFQALADQLDEAGVTYEMHVYDGAPHSFFDRSYAMWKDACADAWRRILDFTSRNAAKPAV
jgi:carboxymethylenebutenolidase